MVRPSRGDGRPDRDIPQFGDSSVHPARPRRGPRLGPGPGRRGQRVRAAGSGSGGRSDPATALDDNRSDRSQEGRRSPLDRTDRSVRRPGERPRREDALDHDGPEWRDQSLRGEGHDPGPGLVNLRAEHRPPPDQRRLGDSPEAPPDRDWPIVGGDRSADCNSIGSTPTDQADGEAMPARSKKIPKVGLEPTRVLPHRILSPARLPFRHFGPGFGISSLRPGEILSTLPRFDVEVQPPSTPTRGLMSGRGRVENGRPDPGWTGDPDHASRRLVHDRLPGRPIDQPRSIPFAISCPPWSLRWDPGSSWRWRIKTWPPRKLVRSGRMSRSTRRAP